MNFILSICKPDKIYRGRESCNACVYPGKGDKTPMFFLAHHRHFPLGNGAGFSPTLLSGPPVWANADKKLEMGKDSFSIDF